MHDVTSRLRPSPDLAMEGEDTPEQVDVRRRAASVVATGARDADDCAMLLDMLGLHQSPRTFDARESTEDVLAARREEA
ncbi:hypothetical protein ACFWY9_19970 [Amycolatopsis sp. NPDC059027]|uniref:hypothetical protein n=1 Tax=Amycolatopsis sp. NPDC059027 TaxID=3346709 RepID=UPI0036732EEB